MSGFDTAAALKTFGFAAVAYLVVLAVGVGVGLSMDEDGFAGLGVVALTTVILAPLGAVIGAYVGMRRFSTPGLARAGWAIKFVVAFAILGGMFLVEAPFQFMVALLGLAVAVILQSGLQQSGDVNGITTDAPAV